jgi:hypothetical protein
VVSQRAWASARRLADGLLDRWAARARPDRRSLGRPGERRRDSARRPATPTRTAGAKRPADLVGRQLAGWAGAAPTAAAGRRPRSRAAGDGGQPGPCQCLLDRVLPDRRPGLGEDAKVATARHPWVESGLLDHRTDMRELGRTGDALAEQPRLTGVGAQQPYQQPDSGGLAGAVGPQEAEDLTLGDLKVEAFHGGLAPEPFGEAVAVDGVARGVDGGPPVSERDPQAHTRPSQPAPGLSPVRARSRGNGPQWRMRPGCCAGGHWPSGYQSACQQSPRNGTRWARSPRST